MQSEARPDKVLDVHVVVDTLITNTKGALQERTVNRAVS